MAGAGRRVPRLLSPGGDRVAFALTGSQGAAVVDLVAAVFMAPDTARDDVDLVTIDPRSGSQSPLVDGLAHGELAFFDVSPVDGSIVVWARSGGPDPLLLAATPAAIARRTLWSWSAWTAGSVRVLAHGPFITGGGPRVAPTFAPPG